MCEANVYLKKKNENEYKELMNYVDKIIPSGDELMIQSIFGERIFYRARVKEMRLADRKILLEEI